MASLSPIAGLPVSAAYPASGISGPAKFYFSDRGFTTGPTDAVLPNKHFAPRATAPLSVERSLPLAPGAGSRVALQLGEIAFVNQDGAMDAFIRDYPIDGRSIEVKIGRRSFTYGQFETIFKGTARTRKQAGRPSVSFELRDAAWELDIPVQRNLYTGAGGLNGGADIAGKPKPLAFGAVANMTPPLVDAANLIYQVHDGPVNAVPAVYDKGAAFTAAGDVADITLAAPAAGTFVTQMSGGYIRLGAVPAGLVTCDVQGDNSYGLYVERSTEIAYRLIRDRAGFADSRIDSVSFDLLRGQQPAQVGIYFGLEPVSLAAGLDTLFGGIGAWWGPNRLGSIECGRLDAPATTATAKFTTKDILDYALAPLPEAVDPPLWRINVGGQPNWTVQDTDLAGSVSAARRVFLGQAYRYGSWSDINIPLTFLRAQDVAVPGLFANLADAAAEAVRLGNLWGKQRSLLRIRTKLQGYLRRLGETVNVDLPIAPLSGGRNAVVVGQAIDAAANEAVLDLLW